MHCAACSTHGSRPSCLTFPTQDDPECETAALSVMDAHEAHSAVGDVLASLCEAMCIEAPMGLGHPSSDDGGGSDVQAAMDVDEDVGCGESDEDDSDGSEEDEAFDMAEQDDTAATVRTPFLLLPCTAQAAALRCRVRPGKDCTRGGASSATSVHDVLHLPCAWTGRLHDCAHAKSFGPGIHLRQVLSDRAPHGSASRYPHTFKILRLHSARRLSVPVSVVVLGGTGLPCALPVGCSAAHLSSARSGPGLKPVDVSLNCGPEGASAWGLTTSRARRR